jgi:hypothetical protein
MSKAEGTETKTKTQMMEGMKMFVERQDNEATLHWSRNSYFMVVISILTVAFSQKPVTDPYQLALFHGFVALLGLTLSVVWLLIQYRSSSYVVYYKTNASNLARELGVPDPYSKTEIKGIEMRILAYFLPLAFLVFWSVLLYVAWLSV